MLIIADSGSTKADWAFLQPNGQTIEVSTKGFNPVFHDERFIFQEMDLRIDQQIDRQEKAVLYFYGSGCWDLPRKNIIRNALKPIFPNAEIEVHHDLLGAARATCGTQAGISCILGTGSNSCSYDGQQVVENVTNLGYLLGDEGSGSNLGKYLIKAYFYNEMPADLQAHFQELVPGGKSEILDNLYGPGLANLYLASFATFASTYQEHPFVQNLIKASFSEFLTRHVLKYTDFLQYPVNFVGSIAFHFQDLLREAVESKGLQMGRVIRKPIQNLVAYHQHLIT